MISRISKAPAFSLFLAWSLLCGLTYSHAAEKSSESDGETMLIAVVYSNSGMASAFAFQDYLMSQQSSTKVEMMASDDAPENSRVWLSALERLRPQLIYMSGTRVLSALLEISRANRWPMVLKGVPVVFSGVGNNELSDLKDLSLSNIKIVTGILDQPSVHLQWKAISAYRSIRTVGFINEPGNVANMKARKALEELARRGTFRIADVELGRQDHNHKPDTMAQWAMRLKALGAEVVYLAPDIFSSGAVMELATSQAAAVGLPSFCVGERDRRMHPCLLNLAANTTTMGRHIARRAMQTLRTKGREEPALFDSPKIYSLLVDLELARSLKIYPPLSLLGVANRIGVARETLEIRVGSGYFQSDSIIGLNPESSKTLSLRH